MTNEIATSIQTAIKSIEREIEDLKQTTKEKKAELKRHQKMLALSLNGESVPKEER